MNVLQLTKGALMGGGERHILTLLEGFQGRPVNMSLAVFTEGHLSAAARKLGIEVYVIPKRYRGDMAPLKDLIHLIRSRHIDIVHTHLISGNVYGCLAGKFAGVKGVISTFHYAVKDALGQFSLPFLQDLFFKVDIMMTAFSDRIVTPSAYLKRLLVEKGVKKDKIIHIPNAVNFDRLRFSEGELNACREELRLPRGVRLVGMVGRLAPVKNFGLFLRAARRVIDAGIKAMFVIIGDGPLRPDLEAMATKLGIRSHIIFTGFREDVSQLVSLLDLFVLCSDSETFSLATVEAMSLKKPVIATSVGAIPELIDHTVNGWLCPPGDEVFLTNSIIYLLTHEETARELGDRAYHKATSTYALSRMTDKLLDVYHGLAH
ncbi:MAG: glycosyltransferase [Thermodesulfobacteriota bacterium]